MVQMTCGKCGRKFNKTELSKNASICHYCLTEARIEKVQSDSFLKENFNKSWSASLFKKYTQFLITSGINKDTLRKNTSKAIKLFFLAEQQFLVPTNISESWILNTLEENKNLKQVKSSMLAFLNQEGIVNLNDDPMFTNKIKRLIDSVPEGFNRLLEVYLNERIEHRKRQIKQNARTPLSFLTILINIEEYVRFIRWLQENNNQVFSWDAIQQEDVHSFLLTLTPKKREIVRKDLLVLFKFARRKRMITHIPILDVKSRELPLTIEPLSFKEQKELAAKLKRKRFEEPLSCLIVSFCFYHGLSSQKIRNIKLQDININNKQIVFSDRPPIYLSDDDLFLLNEYVKVRAKIKNSGKKSFLILSESSTEIYLDRETNKTFISKKVKELTGFTPQALKITCFTSIASRFGSQLLVEGFGLSLTQASRYGKMEDYLIEEEIRNQRALLDDNSNLD